MPGFAINLCLSMALSVSPPAEAAAADAPLDPPSIAASLAAQELIPHQEISGNFHVRSFDPNVSKTVVNKAETDLLRIRRELIPEAEDWTEPVSIHVWPDAETYRTHVPHAPADSLGCSWHEGSYPRIDLVGTVGRGRLHPSLLGRILPHEIAHISLKIFLREDEPATPLARAKKPDKANPKKSQPIVNQGDITKLLAVHEGIAVNAEQSGHNDWILLMAGALSKNSGQKAIPLRQLLNLSQYHQAPSRELFYAQSYSVMDYLRTYFNEVEYAKFLVLLQEGQSAEDALLTVLTEKAAAKNPAANKKSKALNKFEASWKNYARLQGKILKALQKKPAKK